MDKKKPDKRELVSDSLILIGIGLAVCGLWQINPTLGWIAAGAACIGLGVLIAQGGENE